MIKDYDVGKKNLCMEKHMGIQRSTVLLDEAGVVLALAKVKFRGMLML